MQAVYSIPGLTGEQVKQLASALGAGSSVLEYTSGLVNSKLASMEKQYGKYTQ